MVKVVIEIDADNTSIDELKLLAKLLAKLADIREKKVQLSKEAFVNSDLPELDRPST